MPDKTYRYKFEVILESEYNDIDADDLANMISSIIVVKSATKISVEEVNPDEGDSA